MKNCQMQLSLQNTKKAVYRLSKIIHLPVDVDRANIDASLHRFKLSIELFLKLLTLILEDLGVDEIYSPKDFLKKAYAGGLIDDEKAWLGMLKDRNLISHTYDEKLADEIYEHIKLNYSILEKALQKIEQKLELLG